MQKYLDSIVKWRNSNSDEDVADRLYSAHWVSQIIDEAESDEEETIGRNTILKDHIKDVRWSSEHFLKA